MASDILQAFDAGFLSRPAYANPDIMKVLTFESFLAGRCWLDAADKPAAGDPVDPYVGVRRTGGRGAA